MVGLLPDLLSSRRGRAIFITHQNGLRIRCFGQVEMMIIGHHTTNGYLKCDKLKTKLKMEVAAVVMCCRTCDHLLKGFRHLQINGVGLV